MTSKKGEQMTEHEVGYLLIMVGSMTIFVGILIVNYK
jgi:hypothetical protein